MKKLFLATLIMEIFFLSSCTHDISSHSNSTNSTTTGIPSSSKTDSTPNINTSSTNNDISSIIYPSIDISSNKISTNS